MIIETIDVAILLKIKKRMKQLHRSIDGNTQDRFEKRLRNKYFDEDIKRMTKRFFFNQMVQQLSKYMRPNKLLRKFEKKFD